MSRASTEVEIYISLEHPTPASALAVVLLLTVAGRAGM